MREQNQSIVKEIRDSINEVHACSENQQRLRKFVDKSYSVLGNKIAENRKMAMDSTEGFENRFKFLDKRIKTLINEL